MPFTLKPRDFSRLCRTIDTQIRAGLVHAGGWQSMPHCSVAAFGNGVMHPRNRAARGVA